MNAAKPLAKNRTLLLLTMKCALQMEATLGSCQSLQRCGQHSSLPLRQQTQLDGH